MRMLPTRYAAKAQPLRMKKQPAKIEHFSAPLKGIDLTTELSSRDRMTATILKNWVIFEDRIQVRPGSFKLGVHADGKPIETIIPYYGATPSMLLATNGKLAKQDMSLLLGGFATNDWSWTAFANQSQTKYTVMCNGTDGVWSWDGTAAAPADPAAVAVTKLDKTNPATVTVAAADINKFANGLYVLIAGAAGDMAAANGYQLIGAVNTTTNTFLLVNVNLSASAAAQTTGITADPPASGAGLVKEQVLAPTTEPWVQPNTFTVVMSHMNRLWFADTANLAVFYLPLQQKTGPVKVLPLNAVFKRGGTIRAVYTWSIDGGGGMDDKLCIFTSNGECAIYGGVDPDSDFALVGVFRFDAPMSKHCVVNYGGDLYILSSSGFLPMSTLIRAETENLGVYDEGVLSAFTDVSQPYRNAPGWSVVLNQTMGRMICNMPLGSLNNYKQLVRKMPAKIWMEWADLRARSWQWISNNIYYGSDSGELYLMDHTYLNDDGAPITADVQLAWSDFGAPVVKQFKMMRPYILTDGLPAPFVDLKVDYDRGPPLNQPDTSFTTLGVAWDSGTWDVDSWAGGMVMISNWSGVAGLGRVGAARLTVAVTNCTLSVSGFDVLYEQGSLIP